MSKSHWMTVGSVSEAAQQALKDADCQVLYVSRLPPAQLVALHYQDEHDICFTWGYETEIQVFTSGLYLIWRTTSNLEPLYASVIETSLITYDEWAAEREQATAEQLAAQDQSDEIGDLDGHPF